MIDLINLRKEINISPVLADMLTLLLESNVVATSDFEEVIDEPRVAIYRLRKILETLGVTIHSRARLGYWISDKDRAHLAHLCQDDEALHKVLYPQEVRADG